MTAVRTSTCSPWATSADVDSCQPCADYSFPADTLSNSLQVASDILFDLTGRLWPGVCDDVVRPTGRWSGDADLNAYRFGRLASGTFSSWSGVGLGAFCSCNMLLPDGCCAVPAVTLGSYPLVAISQVKIDGVVVDPSTYKIVDRRYLVRMADAEGNNPGWPCCQRLDLDTTEVGTWEVSFTFGTAPPLGGKLAAATLGCELAMACTPSLSGRCRLPSRVQNVARAGVSMVVLDSGKLFDQGRTGIVEIDLWLASVKLGRKERRAAIYSPDTRRRQHRDTT